MCGRAAQTHQTVVVAARSLGVPEASIPKEPSPPRAAAGGEAATTTTTTSSGAGISSSTEPAAATLTTAMMEEAAAVDSSASTTPQTFQQHSQHEWHDNYNMSPGMDAFVVHRDDSNDDQTQGLRCDLMRWGLITRGGTSQAPLDTSSMAQHFALRMFNARTDTLMEKPSFSRLVQQGRTCVVALTGFYEWKETPASKKKQPYFVFGKDDDQVLSYLLLAGLWTRVPTGRTNDHSNGEPEHLDTFTILTTDVSPTLKWLHTRMPVVLDTASAQLWLNEPCKKQTWTHPRQTQLLNQIEAVAHALPVNWHPVTPNMSSLKFRSAESIRPIKEPKSIASFFAATGTTASTSKASTVKSSPPLASTFQPTTKAALATEVAASGSKSISTGNAAAVGGGNGEGEFDVTKKRKRGGSDDNDHNHDGFGRRNATPIAAGTDSVSASASASGKKPPRDKAAAEASPSATPSTKRPSTAKLSSASTTTPSRKTLHSFFSPKRAASSSSSAGGGGSGSTRK